VLADLLRVVPIKPSYVKKTGRLLLEEYPSAFSTDFDHNKESVRALTNIESKTVRNRIAGYVTRKRETEALA
jgi:small subunit ribosomal protein S17e